MNLAADGRGGGTMWWALALGLALAVRAAVGGEVKQQMRSEVIDASRFVDATAPDCGLQRAIDALPPGGTLLLPAGRYVLRRSLMLKSDMTFSGVGPETVLTVAPALPCTTLAADAAKGATEVAVVSVADFTPGMQVTVRDQDNNAWNETFAIITAVEGPRLKLDRPLCFAYAAAKKGQVGNLFPALMAEGQKNLTIQFLRIIGPETQPPFNRFVLSAIHLVRCENVLITHCTVERWHSDGFSVQGGRHARIMENVARGNAGHGFHPGTGLQDSFWSGNLAEGNGAFGLYYCWDNRRTIVSRNRFLANGTYGVGRLGDGRDQDCLVYDNLCERNGAAGIHSGQWGDCKLNFIVGNRVVNNCQKQPGAGILLQKTQQTVVAKNEIVDDQAAPTQVIGVEELADGTDRNYICANVVRGARQALLIRGKETRAGDAYPGDIPPDRLAVLNDLLQREAENWAAWEVQRRVLAPPVPPTGQN